MQTKAAVLLEINQPLHILDLEVPKLKLGQVLVEVAYSGICGSQLNEIRGLKGEDKFLPHTLGHEGSGIVLEVGKGVTKIKPGNHVVLTWIKGSGTDVSSTKYYSSEGPVNSGAISTFMNKTVISENRLVPIPKDLPLIEAALLGCAIPTGAGIVLNGAKINAGESVVVLGVGGIGLSAVMAASAVGAEKIIAVDVLDHKLELARNLGATHVVNSQEKDVYSVINNITDKVGVDYAIEASGNSEAMELAFQSIRTGGGLCVLAGNLPAGKTISIDPLDLIKGKRVIGTWGGETQPDKDIPMYLDLYRTGKLELSPLITQTYKLEEINQALEELEKGKLGRGLIEMV